MQHLAFGNYSSCAPVRVGRFEFIGGPGHVVPTEFLSQEVEGGWVFNPSWIPQNPVLLCLELSYLLKVNYKQQIIHLELIGV